MPPQSAALVVPPAAFFDDYLPAAGSYDEMRTADGEVRPHWRYLIDVLHA